MGMPDNGWKMKPPSMKPRGAGAESGLAAPHGRSTFRLSPEWNPAACRLPPPSSR